jgi:hypothetical protein
MGTAPGASSAEAATTLLSSSMWGFSPTKPVVPPIHPFHQLPAQDLFMAKCMQVDMATADGMFSDTSRAQLIRQNDFVGGLPTQSHICLLMRRALPGVCQCMPRHAIHPHSETKLTVPVAA